MSIKHILKEKEFDIFCKNLNTDNINITNSIDNLKFKAQNGDIIDLSSLPDYGLPSQRLTSNGNGQVSWVSGAGTSGIEYSGGEPVQIGKIAKYSASDGSLVNETSFIDTDILLKDGSVSMTGSLNMNNQSIISVFDIKTNNSVRTNIINAVTGNDITLNPSPGLDVKVSENLNMLNNNIININDVKTDNLSSNITSNVTMNNDLDLNGNNIIGLTTINGIQASGGVYSNTGGFSFSGITAETDILASGTSYGSKNVPANSFKAGDIYTLKIGGQITCANNDTFDIRIVSNFGLPSEAEFSSFTIQIDGARTNGFFEVEVDFSLRAIGTAGVAIITTNGDFTYYNNTNVQKGFGISNINNTTFNTTINNELSITYATTSPGITSFQIDQASLMKFF